MNCWFCNTPITCTEEYQEVKCPGEKCQPYQVTFKFFRHKELDVAQFRSRLNNRFYIINYWIISKRLVIVEQVPAPFINDAKDPFNYEVILDIDCHRQILTPQNVKDKLHLLLLLS